MKQLYTVTTSLMPLLRFALLSLTIIFATVGCGSEGANRKTLLVYTPHGRDLLQDFVRRYEAANPDVNVEFVDMGAREVLERLRAERNRPQADVWWGASQMTFQDAAEENLLTAYRPSWADKVSADTHNQADLWYGTYETPEVIAYNSEVLNADSAPKDWDEVLGEQYKDKVLIRNPIPSDSMRVIYGAMIWREYQKNNRPEGGYDWLRRLDRNVKEYTSDGTVLMQKLARQEGTITLWNMPDAILFREQKNLPIAYNLPTSGTPVIIDGIAIVKAAPHEEEARKFYEFVTTEESLRHAAEKYYRLPVARTDLDRSKLPAWMQTEIKRMPVDYELLRKEGNNWMRYWDAEIRGRNKN